MKFQKQLCEEILGWPGRMIYGSKSGYTKMFPDNFPIFNANVITESGGKVWFGDVDIKTDQDKFREISQELREPIYILSEHDARFQNENQSFEFYRSRAMVIVNGKEISLGLKAKHSYYQEKFDKL